MKKDKLKILILFLFIGLILFFYFNISFINPNIISNFYGNETLDSNNTPIINFSDVYFGPPSLKSNIISMILLLFLVIIIIILIRFRAIKRKYHSIKNTQKL